MARFRTRTQKRAEELLNEEMPYDVLPYSNGEHFPDEPTAREKNIMAVMDEETEYQRRKFGVSRRTFVRTSGAMVVGMWAVNRFTNRSLGYLANAGEVVPTVEGSSDPTWHACDINNEGAQLANPPGEFVFDTQTHHVTSTEKWMALQPVHMAFICAFFGYVGDTEVDNLVPCEDTGRWQYIKDLYLDSAMTAGVLSPIPSHPDEQNPLPFAEADRTANIIEGLSGTQRCVTHGYVMPNRGWIRERGDDEAAVFVPDPLGGRNIQDVEGTEMGTPSSGEPVFMQQELDWMEERAREYRHHHRGWKVYTPYGDVPFTSGMAHDDIAGRAMNDKILELHQKFGTPPVLASHKGVALPTFDARRQACDDVPAAAADYPDIRFVIYHSGGGGHSHFPLDKLGAVHPGTGETNPNGYVDGEDRDPGYDLSGIDRTNMNFGTNGLLANLVDGGLDARSKIPAGMRHGNTVNVYVDLGSRIDTGSPDGMSVFLGKMIKWLGPRRICYGTDALWGGSPHRFIIFLRNLVMGDRAKEIFDLPHGFDGDRFDPRVNARTGLFEDGVTSAYSATYKATLPAEIQENWPTDGATHPERTIMNGILGRNAADAYEHDADQMWKAMSCDDVQKTRDSYLQDWATHDVASLGDYRPAASNMVYGPRNRRDLIKLLNAEWKENGWVA